MSVYYDSTPPNSRNMHFPDSHQKSSSILSSSYPITLKFVDISYNVKVEASGGSNVKRMICGCLSSDDLSMATVEERTILNGVTGMAGPGEILAVLGPSGSGKSTLLNALAGRLNTPALTGSILANDKKLTKPILKRIGFVTQDDVLYPHLTVRETLLYCALLRLPYTLPRSDKISAVDSVMRELGLSKCGDTIIGNAFIRGVSGGERKRVSIAHEMLVNPSLLILDEPTSGLDSTAAHRLVATLQTVAKKAAKTVVMSVHQPSSQVYQMFESVMVLCDGRPIYFGKGSQAMAYFGSVGFEPSFPMNPADFLLDLANGVCHHPESANERDKPNVTQTLISSFNNTLAPRIKAACLDTNGTGATAKPTSLAVRTRRNPKQLVKNRIFNWFYQFSILLQRSLKERRHESFNSLRVSQVIAAALLAGIIWWHSDFRDIQDRLGLLYFLSIFWGVFPSFNAVFAFPQDRAIFSKERASGMYSLSAYFMARITGDLPMELILPTVFLTLVYWMTGLRPEIWIFLLTLAVVLAYVLVAQGLGLAIGAIIMDVKRASTVVTIIMLGCVLTGGFYVHKLPVCLGWIKYSSLTYYSYRLLIYVQYGGGQGISNMMGCSMHTRNYSGANCKFIEEDIDGQIGALASIAIFMVLFLGFRFLAYFALRRVKP
ncbi:hypothetical protein Cgig2_029550 [Carnegiea gigantea]|uniref:ABC transporter domain-containing protein n=1 Tax=Carnegiea gigantea TaxID=171969 RepID=A0A9Q1KKS1_9CARY|nr:hypothetical protein Cgig2_029550 [Carnegiea gigantea]